MPTHTARAKTPRMAGNPKTSKWYATARDARVRKKIEISLSDEAREKLERLADGGHRSPVIEALIMAAPEPAPAKKA